MSYTISTSTRTAGARTGLGRTLDQNTPHPAQSRHRTTVDSGDMRGFKDKATRQPRSIKSGRTRWRRRWYRLASTGFLSGCRTDARSTRTRRISRCTGPARGCTTASNDRADFDRPAAFPGPRSATTTWRDRVQPNVRTIWTLGGERHRVRHHKVKAATTRHHRSRHPATAGQQDIALASGHLPSRGHLRQVTFTPVRLRRGNRVAASDTILDAVRSGVEHPPPAPTLLKPDAYRRGSDRLVEEASTAGRPAACSGSTALSLEPDGRTPWARTPARRVQLLQLVL